METILTALLSQNMAPRAYEEVTIEVNSILLNLRTGFSTEVDFKLSYRGRQKRGI